MSSFDTHDLRNEINIILNKRDSMEIPNGSPTKSLSEKNNLTITETDFIETETEKDTPDKFLNGKETIIKRPHTLEEFVQRETLEDSELKCTFEFDPDNSEDEEIWIIDIPATIDPMELKNQTIQLGGKSKFKIREERYSAISKDTKANLTCVFNTSTSKAYKAVNVKPAGILNVRKKISGISKKNLHYEQAAKVPFPPNLKVRHPFFGVQSDVIKREKNINV